MFSETRMVFAPDNRTNGDTSEDTPKVDQVGGRFLPHSEVINISEYEPEDPKSKAPIRFLRHKDRVNHPDDRVVVVLDQVSKVEPRPTDPELLKFYTEWEKVKSIICLDKRTVLLIRSVLERQNRRKFMIVEGDPAVSKTFGVWAASVIKGALYYRDQYSKDTKDYHVLGRMIPDKRQVLKYTPEELFSPDVIDDQDSETKEFITKLRDKLNSRNKISRIEWDMLQKKLGIPLFIEKEMGYEVSMAMFCLANGIWWACDEPNTASSKVWESAVALFEDLLEVFNNPQHPDGQVKRHRNFWPVFCQNSTKTENRNKLSDAILSRGENETVDPLSLEDLKTLYEFQITGNNPDFDIEYPDQNGHPVKMHYEGEKNLPTDYRQLEKVLGQHVPKFIAGISHFHYSMVEAVRQGQIGENTIDGGNYVIDQRDIVGVLRSIIKAVNGGMVREVNGQFVQESNLVLIIQNALMQVFSKGLQPEDRDAISKLIVGMPLWNDLNRDPNLGNWIKQVGGTVRVSGDENTGYSFE